MRAGASRAGSVAAVAAAGVSTLGFPASVEIADAAAVTARLLVIDTPAPADGFIEAVVLRFPGALKSQVQLVVLILAIDASSATPTAASCVVHRRIGVTLPAARAGTASAMVSHTLVLPSRLSIRKGEVVGIACVSAPLMIAVGPGAGSSRAKFYFSARVPGSLSAETTRLSLSRDGRPRFYGFGATFASLADTTPTAAAAVRTQTTVATPVRSATVDRASEAAALMRRLAGDAFGDDESERLPDAKIRAALVRRNTRSLTWAAPPVPAGRDAAAVVGETLAAAPSATVVSCAGAARLIVEIDTSRELPPGLMLSAMPSVASTDARARGSVTGSANAGAVATDCTGVPLFGMDSICAVPIVEAVPTQAVTVESAHPIGAAPIHDLRTLSFPGACSITVVFTTGCSTRFGAYVRVGPGGGGNSATAELCCGGAAGVAPVWPGLGGVPPVIVDGDVIDVICHSDGGGPGCSDWGWRFIATPSYSRPRVIIESSSASFSVVPAMAGTRASRLHVCSVAYMQLRAACAGAVPKVEREPLRRKAALPPPAPARVKVPGSGHGLLLNWRVMRGPTWQWGEQDGRGPGTICKVRCVGAATSTCQSMAHVLL